VVKRSASCLYLILRERDIDASMCTKFDKE